MKYCETLIIKHKTEQKNKKIKPWTSTAYIELKYAVSQLWSFLDITLTSCIGTYMDSLKEKYQSKLIV